MDDRNEVSSAQQLISENQLMDYLSEDGVVSSLLTQLSILLNYAMLIDAHLLLVGSSF